MTDLEPTPPLGNAASVQTTLVTDRLVLRELLPTEAADVTAGRRPVTEYGWAEGYPLEGTLVAAGALVRAADAGTYRPGFGMFQIIHRDIATVVGDIGFHSAPDAAGAVEIGYGVVPDFRGQGFATEAAVALTRWALERPEVSEVQAETEEDHTPSQGVLGRAGFRLVSSDGQARRYVLRTDADGRP